MGANKGFKLSYKNISFLSNPPKDADVPHFSWREVYRACRISARYEGRSLDFLGGKEIEKDFYKISL